MISVVITAFNSERFIRKSVDSILAQSHADIECIVVDDGSTDGTVDRLREIGDPRLRVVSEGRLGRGRALNLGLENAGGEYVAIQDADDISHPNRLEISLLAIKKSPKLGIVGSSQVIIREGENPKWPEIPQEVKKGKFRDVTSSLLYLNPLSHTTVLMRRETVKAIGGYDESRHNLFDFDLLIRLAQAGYRLGKIGAPLAAHRVHSAQFFEVGNRLSYVHQTYKLQCRVRRVLRGGIYHLPIFWLLLAYRLLPRNIRLGLRKGFLRGSGKNFGNDESIGLE